MSIGSTAVSIQGDKVYLKALKAVASAKGITVAELVRDATDAIYGEQIKPHLIFFCSD